MELQDVPKLAAGCRLHPTESVLLVPEGTLNLSGPTREILSQLDGKKNVTAIVAYLASQYAEADPTEIEADTLSLLSRLRQRGVVRI